MKLMLMSILVLGLQFSASALAGTAHIENLIKLEKEAAKVEAATCDTSRAGASLDGSEVAYGGTQWVCYAKDACGKGRSGCGECRDHAEDKAIARCEAATSDPGTCRLAGNCSRE